MQLRMLMLALATVAVAMAAPEACAWTDYTATCAHRPETVCNATHTVVWGVEDQHADAYWIAIWHLTRVNPCVPNPCRAGQTCRPCEGKRQWDRREELNGGGGMIDLHTWSTQLTYPLCR